MRTLKFRTVQYPFFSHVCKFATGFKFDRVFGSFTTQEEIFDQTLRPIVDDVLSGFEATVFAYGQTGTGKTYTMEGAIDDEADMGKFHFDKSTKAPSACIYNYTQSLFFSLNRTRLNMSLIACTTGIPLLVRCDSSCRPVDLRTHIQTKIHFI